MLYCAGVKVCLPMTTRSDIPCPRPFKRDNHFIMLEKGIFLKPFKALQTRHYSVSGNQTHTRRNHRCSVYVLTEIDTDSRRSLMRWNSQSVTSS